MPGRLKLELSEAERAELEDARDHSPLPYVRERAAGILKVADGLSGREVARNRLNRAHCPDTIYEWVKRYRQDKLEGLKIRTGRGRKPAFSPSASRARKRSGCPPAPAGAWSPGIRPARHSLAVADPAACAERLAGQEPSGRVAVTQAAQGCLEASPQPCAQSRSCVC